MFTLLFALLVTLGLTPASSTTKPTTTTTNCWCQTMPGKDWGK